MVLGEEIADWPVGSTAVVVVNREGIVEMVDDQRIHPWASVTKIATALTILDAVLEGVVGLDDEVGPPGSTLRHLLAHASGLAMDGDQVLGRPGTRRIYSNTGIDQAAAHLAGRTGRPFSVDLSERLLQPLGMSTTTLKGPPSHGAESGIGDLATLARELLEPDRLPPEAVTLASTPEFPGLSGILPGFGRQPNNDWGLGCEIRDHKNPHWTAPENSPRTFGHFGQSGSFLWVDPGAGLACACLSDTAFGEWAADRWPRLSSAVLQHLS